MKYIFIVDIDNHYRLFIFILRFIQLFTEELNTGSGGRLIVKNLCVTIPDKKEQPYPEVSANGIAMALVRETDMIFLMMVLHDLHRAARFFGLYHCIKDGEAGLVKDEYCGKSFKLAREQINRSVLLTIY